MHRNPKTLCFFLGPNMLTLKLERIQSEPNLGTVCASVKVPGDNTGNKREANCEKFQIPTLLSWPLHCSVLHIVN